MRLNEKKSRRGWSRKGKSMRYSNKRQLRQDSLKKNKSVKGSASWKKKD